MEVIRVYKLFIQFYKLTTDPDFMRFLKTEKITLVNEMDLENMCDVLEAYAESFDDKQIIYTAW